MLSWNRGECLQELQMCYFGEEKTFPVGHQHWEDLILMSLLQKLKSDLAQVEGLVALQVGLPPCSVPSPKVPAL